ncbi:hypothetical protein [Photobacterium indicum]|uniref:Curli production assembly/transport component CsgG n=1 Tax=Photobacterium indicum TaxID=81447 RepID=A0A2T3LC53_9GAMM|nr:hypothetical protein [Photobacterium indicum]PSV48920.1 hypothetical protein C9J47_06765 [Photobacterium indicum]
MFKKTLLATILLTTLSGCVTTGPERVCTPDTKVAIETADVKTPSTENLKVIVLPVDAEFKDSSNTKVKSVLRNDLEAQIAHSGANLVDRKLANKLKNEIKLAEQSGRYNSKGVPIADYAILTEIISTDLSKSYKEAYTYENKDGETKRVPAKCSYKVDIKAIAKVVSLPSMELVKRIELTGDESITTETRSSKCPISSAQYTGLASKAAAESVSYTHDLKKMLAPSASILELRQCTEGSMVKIAMGTNKKVTPGIDVAFSKSMKNDDGEVETFALGEGTVVSIPEHGIKAKYSWVSVDKELAKKVQKGNIAKIIPEECSFIDIECQAKEWMK